MACEAYVLLHRVTHTVAKDPEASCGFAAVDLQLFIHQQSLTRGTIYAAKDGIRITSVHDLGFHTLPQLLQVCTAVSADAEDEQNECSG